MEIREYSLIRLIYGPVRELKMLINTSRVVRSEQDYSNRET